MAIHKLAKIMHPWARYQSMIPHFSQMLEAHREQKRIAFLLNSLKTTRSKILNLWPSSSSTNPLPHQMELPEALLIPPAQYSNSGAGNLLEHACGHYYILGASSALAAREIVPRPGDIILDLCSAPGGKALSLIAFYGEKFQIVANEVELSRLRILQGNLDRWGCTNVATTHLNGLRFHSETNFDHIILDVPCSSEATWFGLPLEKQNGVNESFRRQLTKTQINLLEHSFSLLKPGGTLLYATCTYAPEENEGVITRFLDHNSRAKILPLGFNYSFAQPGLENFNGIKFHRDLRQASRLYPHLLPGHGFFYVKITKN